MTAILWMFSNNSDVKKLQQLLNRNEFTPVLVEDGIFGKNTYDAVKIFQRYNGLNDDGIVGPQTWRKLGVPELLTRSSSGSPASPSSGPSRSPSADSNGTVAETGDGFCFPFPALPARSWTNGGRQFGASRSGGRRHAGCDLIFPRGTLIYAVADGILVQPPYPFYEGTSAVEIRHGNLLLRYGEIINGSYVGGQTVQKGQVIAKVGRLHSGSSMLHLEIYTNATLSGGLTDRNRAPYQRRSDVTDPAPYLDIWKNNLPTL